MKCEILLFCVVFLYREKTRGEDFGQREREREFGKGVSISERERERGREKEGGFEQEKTSDLIHVREAFLKGRKIGSANVMRELRIESYYVN